MHGGNDVAMYSIVQKKGGEVQSRFATTYLEAKPQAAPRLKFELMKFVSKNYSLWPMVHGL